MSLIVEFCTMLLVALQSVVEPSLGPVTEW